MPFSALGLSTHLIKALEERHHLAPTPVQAEAIPAILRGSDVWAQAQTGSGKTAAFALPILQHGAESTREARRNTPVLVLVPTRELAAQVAEAFRIYGQHLTQPPKVITAAGGVSINPQMMALGGGADVIVATPGRLLDLFDHNAVHLDAVKTLVLDEADQLFALGFADELGRILALLPTQRQNLLFSATFPTDVTTLAEALLHDPVRITIASTPVTAPAITERAIEVDAPRRTQLLRHLIETHSWTRVLVFVATKYATGHVAEKLRRVGIEAGSLHGELSQGARTQTLADFDAGKIPVLIATDLAARGLDFTQLSLVINYDLPRSAIIYTHRIGRTGRAGETGEAISFVSAATFELFQLIEKRLERPIPREQIPGFEPAEIAPPEAPRTGGVKGKRKSKKDKLREAAGLPPGTPLNSPGEPGDTAPEPKPAPRKSTPTPRPSKPRPARPERSRDEPGGRDSAQLESSENAFRWHRAPPGRRRL